MEHCYLRWPENNSHLTCSIIVQDQDAGAPQCFGCPQLSSAEDKSVQAPAFLPWTSLGVLQLLLRPYQCNTAPPRHQPCNSAPGVATFPSHWPSWTDRFICFFSCGELLDIFCCCCWTIYCSYSSLVVGSIDLPTSACLHPCAEQWGKCNIVFVISVCNKCKETFM